MEIEIAMKDITKVEESRGKDALENKNLKGGCMLCPKGCSVNREKATGTCGQLSDPRVARAALHFWEEPPLSGFEDENGNVPGSGTVFFSGCPLDCVYCQNKEISSGEAGKTISVQRLAQIFLELQEKGALNINLVTPMHFLPSVKEALHLSKARGLHLPVVANVSGYDLPQTIQALRDVVDIWLVDAKYFSETLARDLSCAPGYFEIFQENLVDMVRLTMEKGATKEREDGTLLQGVMVRHLVLPGQVVDSKRLLEELAKLQDQFRKEWGAEAPFSLSIMNQYTPPKHAPTEHTSSKNIQPAEESLIFQRYPDLLRSLSTEEYEEVLAFAKELGFEGVWTQEEGTATESFIPAFNLEGVQAN